MKTGLWPLQEAVYSRLSNDMALMARIKGIEDEVPIQPQFPFIQLGNDTANHWDTKTDYGSEITMTLHVWSRYNGKKEAKEILDLVLESVTSQPLTVMGFDVITIQRDMMEVFLDDGGFTTYTPTYHGVLRLRFKIEEV